MKYIALGIVLFLIMIFISENFGNNNIESKKEIQIDCKGRSDYKSGFEAGHEQAVLVYNGVGGTSIADTYLQTVNNGYGPIGEITDCWREGFDDGFESVK